MSSCTYTDKSSGHNVSTRIKALCMENSIGICALSMCMENQHMCAQHILEPAWTSSQSDQILHSVFIGELWISDFLVCTTKTLVSLGECPGWSESLLNAHIIPLALTDPFQKYEFEKYQHYSTCISMYRKSSTNSYRHNYSCCDLWLI